VEVVVEITLVTIQQLVGMVLLVVEVEKEEKTVGLLLIPAQVLLNMEMTEELVIVATVEAVAVELEPLVAIRLVEVVIPEVMAAPDELIQLLELQLHIPVVVADRVIAEGLVALGALVVVETGETVTMGTHCQQLVLLIQAVAAVVAVMMKFLVTGLPVVLELLF
jgi:hypothetical protein